MVIVNEKIFSQAASSSLHITVKYNVIVIILENVICVNGQMIIENEDYTLVLLSLHVMSVMVLAAFALPN